MERIVIAAYRPRPGRSADLLALVQRHGPLLRAEGLVTDRPTTLMQAADGTVLEVFGWASPQAIEQAHANAAVQRLWTEFEAVCEHVSLSALAESGRPFADFAPLDPSSPGGTQ